LTNDFDTYKVYHIRNTRKRTARQRTEIIMKSTRTYSSTEAGTASGVSSQAIRWWVEEGRLRVRSIGLRRILRSEEAVLEHFARQNEVFSPNHRAEIQNGSQPPCQEIADRRSHVAP
jgi:hypothetical protein